MAAFVNIAIAEACPAHLCSPLRTETENAKRSFEFFITTTAGKPISGKLPRHSLLQGNGAFCQKWEQKTPRIFKNLWRCCLEQYSILVSRSLFWVKEKDNRFWLSCENVYYVVLCMIDKIKFEDHYISYSSRSQKHIYMYKFNRYLFAKLIVCCVTMKNLGKVRCFLHNL